MLQFLLILAVSGPLATVDFFVRELTPADLWNQLLHGREERIMFVKTQRLI